MHNEPWKKRDLDVLRECYSSAKIDELALALTRTPMAIRIMAHRLGLTRRAAPERMNLEFTKKEEQLIVGGLLGDLSCRRNETCLHPRLEGAHCFRQREYVLWKTILLKKLRWGIWKTKNNAYQYHSRTFPALEKYFQLFYHRGNKTVDENILNLVDDFGLLIWYLDDGSYHKRDKTCVLHTNGFSLYDQIIIQDWFYKKYGIVAVLQKVKHPDYPGKLWYCLRFRRKASDKLLKTLRKFEVPDCMKYKLGLNPSSSTDYRGIALAG